MSELNIGGYPHDRLRVEHTVFAADLKVGMTLRDVRRAASIAEAAGFLSDATVRGQYSGFGVLRGLTFVTGGPAKEDDAPAPF
jgi:hypothetical protein